MLSSSRTGIVSTSAAEHRGHQRRGDRERHRRQRRDGRPHPPRQRNAARATAHDERERAGDRLVGIPRKTSGWNRRDRRVRREFPRVLCGSAISSVRIVQPASRSRRRTRGCPTPPRRCRASRETRASAAAPTAGRAGCRAGTRARGRLGGTAACRRGVAAATTLNASAADRHRRRLPSREHAQQEREQARSDVDPLARRFGMRGSRRRSRAPRLRSRASRRESIAACARCRRRAA